MKNNWVKIVALSLVVGIFGVNTPTIVQAEETTKNEGVAASLYSDEGIETYQTKYGQWVQKSGRWCFRFEDGTYAVNGRYTIGNQEYAFDKSGYMVTGWYKNKYDDGTYGWYYYNQNGTMYRGWLKQSGKWYYFDLDYGYMVEDDWRTDNGYDYYFNADGTMHVGWLKTVWDDGEITWHYYFADGKEARGWLKLNNKWYYMDPEGGYMYENTSECIDGHYYLFDENGYMFTGWKQVDGDWYFFNNAGHFVYNAWSGNYYFDEDGKMVKNQWIGEYYVGVDGMYRPAKWMQTNGKWWYRHQDESYTKNDFETISGQTYYFDGNGYMVTGWKQVGSTWYFFNSSGIMAKNKWVGDYYFDNSGAMVTNKWIGNCYVGADGKWIPNYKN